MPPNAGAGTAGSAATQGRDRSRLWPAPVPSLNVGKGPPTARILLIAA